MRQIHARFRSLLISLFNCSLCHCSDLLRGKEIYNLQYTNPLLWLEKCYMFLFCRMKLVGLFLVLSLVVLMAEPGECSFKKLWGGLKAAFKGAKDSWKGYKQQYAMNKQARIQQEMQNQQGGGEPNSQPA
ncbi:hypothetical protein AMECASPLE_025178 [Ameca splendens]|uniref:Uncharacterized protein n=1 Tax=Ameca splendens TaxID=208324 RepID=A0ABV0ZRD2_9TELE